MTHRPPLGLVALVCLGALALGPPLTAHAQQQGAQTTDRPFQAPEFQRHRLIFNNVTVLRLNPLGLIDQAQLGYQYMLFNDDSPLFKGTYAKLAFAPSVSPAFGRWGALAEVMPLAVLRLSVLYEYMSHFGTFGTIQSFPTPNADYSDTTLKERRGTNYATTGQALTFGGLLQAKVGPIAARVNYRAVWSEVDTKDRKDDKFFYDIMFDALIESGNWMHTTDSDLLYLTGPWSAGVRHTWLHTVYSKENVPDGEPGDHPNTHMHRVGPLVAYQISDTTGTKFNQPTTFLLAQWWLNHRWRTGEDVSQAFPYILMGFAFNSDLL